MKYYKKILDCDSDWCESDDDLIGDDQVGELDGKLPTRSDPLDRAEDTFQNAEYLDTIFPSNNSVIVEEPSLDQHEAENDKENPEASTSSSICTQVEEDPTVAISSNMFPVTAPILPSPGPITTDMDEDNQHPNFFFAQMWSTTIFKEIAEQTNLYAAQKALSPKRSSSSK
jgi:hypothetical protein